ncbi:MAG: glutamine--fructose-6-phosphate transaminase (isomerizing) [Thermoplasmatota archaeon]
MCGIIGAHGITHATAVVRRGLERLEYRGYDSAGLAWLEPEGIEVLKGVGRVGDLAPRPPNGETVALGHTRWATHGKVTEENAHPHLDATGRFCVVHNGTIEGYKQLRSRLEGEGHAFRSQTDTEIIAHLYERARRDDEPLEALRTALGQIEGSWAVGIMDAESKSLLFARHKTPLILGIKEKGALMASDVTAILDHTRRVVYLDDGDHGVMTDDGILLFDSQGAPKPLVVKEVDWDVKQAEKSGYAHYMLKEIHEAPTALNACLAGRISRDPVRIETGVPPTFFAKVSRVRIVGCGTSYHAALMGRHFFEDWAGLPCEALVASDLRERSAASEPGTLFVAVSQSGETLDTLEAVKPIVARGLPVLAITNVEGSTLSRLANHTILTRVGPEVGVAATKTLLGQVATLALTALAVGQQRRHIDGRRLEASARDLQRLPRVAEEATQAEPALRRMGERLAKSSDLFFLGHGLHVATALEAALKFKEISYLHAEGFGAAELKHGPFALLSASTPCIFFVPAGPGRARVISSMIEVAARGAPTFAIAQESGTDLEGIADEVVVVPGESAVSAAISFALAGQLVAYHAAAALDRSIDMPRNLAKSVTVE